MCKLKTVLCVNIGIFSVLGLIHVARLFMQWDVQFAGWSVPLWLNGVFVVLAGVLVYLNAKRLK